MAYPNDIDAFSTINGSDPRNAPSLAARLNALAAAIVAIENELAADPSGTFATVKARLEAMAQLNKAQTFTEDQTIEPGNDIRFGDVGGAGTVGSTATAAPTWRRNARFDGTSWVRTLGDNDAAMLAFENNGDLTFYTNSDAGTTVGSAITWAEKLRISKAGRLDMPGQHINATKPVDGLAFASAITGDIEGRFILNANGHMAWGSGAGVQDTTLYRAAANILGTDDSFQLANGSRLINGGGSPEGAVAAPPGSLWLNSSGGVGTTLYAKHTGTGNTGWGALT